MQYMKEVIFDASTLILLAKITLLQKVAKEIIVIIPQKVKEEAINKETFDSNIIKELLNNRLIKVNKVKMDRTIMQNFNLEEGETESITLARQRKAILATDDGPTIKTCKTLNIPFLTAIHFLIKMIKENKLDHEIGIEKLKMLDRYGRYDPRIIEGTFKKLEEFKK